MEGGGWVAKISYLQSSLMQSIEGRACPLPVRPRFSVVDHSPAARRIAYSVERYCCSPINSRLSSFSLYDDGGRRILHLYRRSCSSSCYSCPHT
eukprot:scaffold8973_cov75-Skeletonema_dohrnii-CCMP3373.AAC.10